ncbi:flagellar motor switch protein FliN [Idiomarina sp. HP20-50]|uniref:flagellar motor switch protein FliN n=1 Tax=Idiomarina sp. HP20-50 TaxID=3070813 RepID=UPI00294B21EB|nr:flagellar motor switch protein FliN [Idiomarina sp. HP20-50]MDV6317309.1 flagellar motor switch protein FliN [Idiomarina sp. HP20-50]
MSNDDKDMDDWEAAMAEQEAAEDEESGASEGADKASSHSGMDNVQTAELEELSEDKPVTEEEKRKLDAILDIPVTISMEVGRSQISIRNLLQLNQGSVVELERVAGEPLDVLVNGTLIAHGEVVVVNDKFGIRLTDVISQIERIRKLR